MFKKVCVVLINLVIGNGILWASELARNQSGLDPRFMAGFSTAAIFLLTLAFRWLKPGISWLKIVLLAAGVSLLVPIIGLSLSFVNLESLDGTLNGVFFGVLIGAMVYKWTTPMILLNIFLFRWMTQPTFDSD